MNFILDFNTDKVMLVELNSQYQKPKPTRCNCYFLVLCNSGECELELDYIRYRLKKDAILTIFPFDIVTMYNATDDFNCSVLVLPSGTFAPIMHDIDFVQMDYMRRNPVQYYGEGHLSFVRQVFTLLKEAYGELDYGFFEKVAVRMVASLHYIHQNYISKSGAGSNSDRVYLSRKKELFRSFVKGLIDSRCISREVLYYANEIGISSGYLNEICNEVSGHSAKEIIDSATVARLKYELTYTSKSIQELSDEYNFPSQSYFCRYYRRLAGVTPSEYRKERSKSI